MLYLPLCAGLVWFLTNIPIGGEVTAQFVTPSRVVNALFVSAVSVAPTPNVPLL